jgi:hypothetical protein
MAGNVLKGIAHWEEQSLPAHLPGAIVGLGVVEAAVWLQNQRAKEKEDIAKQRIERKKAMDASHERCNSSLFHFFSCKL